MIQLSDEHQRFVDEQVSTGRFDDPAEVVEAGIELLRRAASGEYEATVREVENAIPAMQAGLGKSPDDVEAGIRSRLGLSNQA